MDFLDKLVEENTLSKKMIRSLIDDYSIVSYYIGQELEERTKYSSPLRHGDEDPSFSIYYSKYKPDVLMFKDQSTGTYGDAFMFVRMMIGGYETPVSLKVAMQQINSDFGLGIIDKDAGEFKPQLVKKPPIRKVPVQIRITKHEEETEEFIQFWDNLGVTRAIRDMYKIRCPKLVHYIGDVHKTMQPRTLTISYEIMGRFKIYHPFEDKKFKFRNNYLTGFVEGALQLKYHKDFAVITKSMKEIAFMRQHFDWDCVAGPSENSYISDHFMGILKEKYKKVYIWLDNDEAGQNAQARYLKEYPWLKPIVFHKEIEQKDPTDFYLAGKSIGYGDNALKYLKGLIEK